MTEARLGERSRHEAVVGGGSRAEQRADGAPRAGRDAADDPEVDEPHAAVLEHLPSRTESIRIDQNRTFSRRALAEGREANIQVSQGGKK